MTTMPAPARSASPLILIVRAGALTLMALCLALPLMDLITSLAPSLNRTLLLGVTGLAALEAHYSFHLIRTKFISGPDAWRFRLVEFGFYFVAVKIAQFGLEGLPPEAANLLQLGDVRAVLTVLFNLEAILALVIAVGAAWAITDVLGDLERVGEPPERNKQYVSPLDSLTGRFFMGGAWLLALSGLARIGLADVFNLERPPVTGLVANVLVYFLLGFLLLGQVRLQLLTARWDEQGVRVPAELPSRWVRYSLTFVGLAALLAFALPTGYTAGALGFIGNALILVIAIMWTLVSILASLCLLPLGLLISLLTGGNPPDSPVPIIPPPPPTESLLPQALPPWAEVARTVVVWVLVVAMVLYVVVQFLRDRPELTRALRELALGRRLRQLWAAFRHRASGLAAAARASSLAAWLRERWRSRAPLAPLRYFRLGGAPPGEQVMFYYFSLLRRARERGFGRRPPQTPREYEPVLESRLDEAAPAVKQLTEVFEETRYSGHPVGPEAAEQAREAWRRIRAVLVKPRKAQAQSSQADHGPGESGDSSLHSE